MCMYIISTGLKLYIEVARSVNFNEFMIGNLRNFTKECLAMNIDY